MKRFLPLLLLLLLGLPLRAAEIVTATITITNAPSDADTITINAGVRTWKTTAAVAASEIAIDGIGGSATNLYQHLLNYTVAGLTAAQIDTNVVTLTTLPTTTVSVTLSTTFGEVSYATNTLTALVAVRVPFSSIPDPSGTNKAYQANQLLQGISDHGTNFLELADGGAALPILSFKADTDTGLNRAAANTIGLSAQGTNQLTIGPHRIEWHVDATLNGTNGTLGGMILNNPTSSNLVNYGNAISSPGSASNAEQFGTGATASGDSSTAVGRQATATAVSATALGRQADASSSSTFAGGYSSSATAAGATALGAGATAGGLAAIGIGDSATASGDYSISIGSAAQSAALNAIGIGYLSISAHTNSVAIGNDSDALHASSVAIGANALTTAANQIRLGTSSEFVSVPGNLTVAGTVEQASIADLRLPRLDNTSLATGNNAAVAIGTNSFVRISSGPGGAFSINGIAGGSDGRFVTLYNATSQNMTIANDSGVDSTAANRIYTLTGGDVALTGTSAATFIYDSGASRWILTATRD